MAEPAAPLGAAFEGTPDLRITLGGRSRAVGAASAGALSALSFSRFGPSLDGLVGAVLGCSLVALSLADLGRHVLPNRLVLGSAAAVSGLELAADPPHFPARLALAACVFAGFLLVALAYPPGLGMGDVKLSFLLGMALGHSVFLAVAIGMLSASLASVGVLLRHGRRAQRAAIPFGPCLAAGALLAWFLG